MEHPMIAYVELPPEANRIDRELKSAAAEIVEHLPLTGKQELLDNGTDLFTHTSDGWVFIRNGVFKYYFGSKLIRLYSAGDLIVVLPTGHEIGCTCISEFGAEVCIFKAGDLEKHLGTHPSEVPLLLRYLTLQSTMMHVLCAAFMTEDMHPDLNIRKFDPGSVIIAEGAPAREIYQMIQGNAVVTVNNVHVGEVAAGEVFGEISFFTESTRSATVIAKTECLVQVMGKDEFITLVQLKPSVNLAISKTLSHRIVETNRRIAGQED
jgi:CRP/FNR family cyclic AMP-dependent transcriptional regulator